MKRALLPAALGLPIPLAAFGPLRTFAGHPRNHDRPDTGGVVWWDQADGAFGSAAVLRPAGSPFMPLRRTHRRPDPAPWSEATRGSKQRGGQVLFCHSNDGVSNEGVTTRGSGLVLPHRGGRVFFANVAKQDLTPVLAPGCACRDAGLFVFGRSGSGLPRTRPCMRTSAGSGLVLPYRNARPDPFPRVTPSRVTPSREHRRVSSDIRQGA